MLGQVSREIRLKYDLTQKELAAYIGCSERTLSRIETGKTKPIPAFQHALLSKRVESKAKDTVKTYRICADSMRRSLGKAHGWNHWKCWKRGLWLRWKRYYKRILAEEQMGVARIEYVLRKPRPWR